MFRRAVIATLVLLLLNASSVVAVSAGKSTRIKTPKGTKTNTAVARNPNTGDVFVAYEASGNIYGTLAKKKGPSFKAKKAKILSSKDGNNHRPSAAWDEMAAEFLVSWDTGPESLLDASDQSRVAALEPADILSRRVKRKNGKGTKSVVPTVADGRSNLGPLLASRGDTVTMFYTSHSLLAPTAGRQEPVTLDVFDDVFRGEGMSPAENIADLAAGLVELVALAENDDDFCIVFTEFLSTNSTARYIARSLSDGDVDIFEDATPTVFDFVVTRGVGFILDRTENWIDVWEEDGDDRLGRGVLSTVFFEILDAKGRSVVSPRGLGSPIAFTASNPIRAMEDETARAMSDPLIAAAASDGKARLFVIDTKGNTESIELFDHKNDIGQMKLIDLEDGRVMVVFIREKNAKNHEVWMHVVDLPTGEGPRTQ